MVEKNLYYFFIRNVSYNKYIRICFFLFCISYIVYVYTFEVFV